MSDSADQINRTGHYTPNIKACNCQEGQLCTKGDRYDATVSGATCRNNEIRNKNYDPRDMDNYRCFLKIGHGTDDTPKDQDTLRPILKQRGQEYGEFSVMCARIQAIKLAMFTGVNKLKKDLSPEQTEALEMIATKLGRILCGNPNNIDSWTDIIGYCTLVVDRIPKPATGQAYKLPFGWTINPRGGFNGPMGAHWVADILSLRQHLRLEEPA